MEQKWEISFSMGIVLLYSFVHSQHVSSFRLSLVPFREKKSTRFIVGVVLSGCVVHCE